jgi:hypothetical protein
MKAAASRYGSTMPQLLPNNAITPENEGKKDLKPDLEADFTESCSDADKLLWRLIQRLRAEKSDSAIVTEVLGYTGQRYSEGKTLLEKLRQQFGG